MGARLAVQSIDEEDELIGRCRCGSPWRLIRNIVEPVSGAWLDFVGLRCPACDSRAIFTFDVTSFFEARPGVWGGGLGHSHAGSRSHNHAFGHA